MLTELAPYHIRFTTVVMIDVLVLILAGVAIVALVTYTLAEVYRHRYTKGRG